MAMFTLTNKIAVERCQALFSTIKASYNFPNVNREKSRTQLEAHLKAKLLEVAYISDFQGAGKSTLMEMAANTLKFLKEPTAMVRAKDVSPERLTEDLRNFGALFVDDADIRTSWRKIVDGLRSLQDFASEHPCPIVVCGDFTLRNEELREVFGSLPQREIKMEAVDRQFFLEALNHRLRYLFPDSKDEILSDGNYIFDDDLLRCLVPDSAIPVATFREVLSLSEGISNVVEPTDEEFRLTREHAEIYCQERPLSGPSNQQQWSFLKLWLKPFVTQVHPLGSGMEPFDTNRVLNEVKIDGIDDAEALLKDVLEPLAAGGFLHALGVPSFQDGEFNRYPSPFLPRPTFLLHAYAGGEDWPPEDE
ncbi:MAG: hypothetical protein QOK48_501 [Blastocatellia bacterium]|jgi:hypothetical protein|nr:hypothetical protein [Blastocatellia bacterium]